MLSVVLSVSLCLAGVGKHPGAQARVVLLHSQITIWDSDGCQSQARTQPSDVAVELRATGGAFARRIYCLRQF